MTLPHAASLPDHGLSHGLPNAHYTNADVISRENAAVLAGGWASIGFAKDVANKGDVAPVTFLEQPLMLVRGSDGNVRVFENVCRHRGMILVDQPTNFKGTIRCPYHSWCYAFDGKLRTTPHVGGPGIHTHADVDPAKLGLYDVAFGCTGLARADEAVGWDAWSDGQAFGRDHRNADHLKLQGRSDRS